MNEGIGTILFNWALGGAIVAALWVFVFFLAYALYKATTSK